MTNEKTAPKFVLGIDPGRQGALAGIWLYDKSVVGLTDLPLDDNGGLHAQTFCTIIEGYKPNIKFCILEKVSAMVYRNAKGEIRGQGATASFTFGRDFGIIIGVLAAFEIPVIFVNPSVWKAQLNLSSNKAESIALAKKLYPESAQCLTLKKHDGRAEAILLAHFGLMKFGGGK